MIFNAGLLPETPAFVYDADRLLARLQALASLRRTTGVQLFYSIKASPLLGLLRLIQHWVDGFSVSSLFEARLARHVLGEAGLVHITTPGLRPDEMPALQVLCDRISCNSLSQWRLYAQPPDRSVSWGLRINPQRSQGLDPRFDPCRPHSKLGVPLADLQSAWPGLQGVDGLHVHTSFDACTIAPLLEVVECLERHLADLPGTLSWLNLGGGYRLDNADCVREFADLGRRLHACYGTQIIYEPGKALVGDAGMLVTSVIDLFSSDGRNIAVLDTTVGHLPRIFEYQLVPTVVEADTNGAHEYVLAGASCLAGDLLGVHRFARPLTLGSRVTIGDVGAYMLVKASRFNGINLPAVYLWDAAQGLILAKSYDYDSYISWWG